MEIYNKLTSIFSDKWFNIRYRGGVYDIVETDKCASVKMAEIEYHGKLMSIDKDIFNKTDFLFYDDDKTQNGMPKLKHSCDGVLIIENREQKYIVFIELKSEYSQENILKAETQLCASYFRTMALLQCTDEKDFNKYKKCGIIVSHQVKSETVTRLQKIRTQKIRTLSRFEKQCLKFASNDFKPFPISKLYSKLDRLPIKKELMFEELATFHVNVNRGETQVKFDLDKILMQI